MTGDRPIRIGNASGFYGDRLSAFEEMLTGGPLDYLTGDYLAELTMGILGRDLAKDPATGYARTFLRQMETGLGLALDRGVRIVVNAGGLNPAGLAEALAELAGRLGLHPRIGYVTGDRVPVEGALTANAYLGAFGIAACLDGGADVVVTGRVTDASLTVGPAAAHFGWARDDFDSLAGATVAGHVIECGAQATGGNYPFFGEIADMRRPGFPIAEVAADGRSTITKHPGTGGAVTVGTVTAQLLYEIGGPRYLGPDVTTHLDTVRLEPDGEDRVRITGVKGSPPPSTLKVGVTRLGGFRSSMTFVLCGLDIEAKADLVMTQLTETVRGPLDFDLVRTDHEDAATEETASAFLRVNHTTDRPGRDLSRAAVELALSSYPGATLTTPPTDATPFAVFTAESLPQSFVDHVAVLPAGERVAIAPPDTVVDDGPDGDAGGAVRTPTDARHGPDDFDLDLAFVPLGRVIGARAGDKGADANVGVWARSDAAYAWLRGYLTSDELRRLLPGVTEVERHEFPHLRAINFVLRGLLGATRFDPQAKSLGEWLRARYVHIPTDLL